MPIGRRIDVVIPARFQSSRYPGKPLALLKGAGGISRSLVERTWRTALSLSCVDHVWIATDDERIAAEATRFGADCIMTSSECRNGTERCADALTKKGLKSDVIINLQGDAPLTPSWFVEKLVDTIVTGRAEVATPVLRSTAEIQARLRADRADGIVGATTAVFNADGQAMYFSKEILPFHAREEDWETAPVFHHVGLYAYSRDALLAYAGMPECPIERAEGLEQLRFLYNAIPVQCVEVDARGREFWELNNPSDVSRIEAILASEGLE